MKKVAIIPILILSFLGMDNALAGVTSTMPKPALNTPEIIEKGKDIYIKRCSFCHGLMGDGNGPAADYMDPRPRDFTLGTFKFRTTQSGELPLDEDLFRTISRGLTGTGMQAFDSDLIKNGLSEQERWEVIAYIRTFAQEFEDEEFDPYKKIVKLPGNQAPHTPEIVAKGKEVFEKAKCWECHGKLGRGNGLKAFDKTDDWGFPIRIRNVTHPWKIKAGGEVEDIYMRFSSGINGTPMPSFVKALTEEERWQLANFIKSLQHQQTKHQVLKVHKVEGDLPEDAKDAAWAQAESMDIRLTGQVVAAPRWQNPGIELTTIKALANDKEIAFLAVWDDPFEDRVHKQEEELDITELRKVGAFNSYVKANDMIPRQLETFRDSIALQFPVKPPEGTKKPYFFRGSASDAVNLWVWKSDMEGKAEEMIARGWNQSAKPQKEEQQTVTAKAVWEEGRWSVVMKRALITEDKNDVQFVEGKFVPLAMNAWDGSNGEHGLIMSLSTWHYVVMEASTPFTVYVYAVLAVLVVGGFGFWLMKKAEAEKV
ncbi:MAG: c-type cytochrome [Gammaproteobacteria bacterium]|nr:c-type cytochrome [Gammaproteobacteria bacterium]